MRRRERTLLCSLCVLFFIASCSTVPITGRTQLSLVPPSSMLSMSLQQYDQFLKSNTVSADKVSTAMVKDAGSRIQKAVETYFIEHGMRDELSNYAWEFNLIESKEVNAWCMPGGKVAVYTGILPVTKDENGLAVVMGHEIAHAVAGHGGERMSHLLAVQMGGLALAVAMAEKPESSRNLWFAAFGLGAQVGFILPYSRVQEYEADRLGLIFMAMAGYEPRHAVTLWERMAAQKEGKKAPPAFLSTHPADAARIASIRNAIPEAMRYYRKPR
jgi:predicted Zn-dependent protease